MKLRLGPQEKKRGSLELLIEEQIDLIRDKIVIGNNDDEIQQQCNSQLLIGKRCTLGE